MPTEKSVLAFARYTLENAVKDGLADRWENYPYCGSLVFNLHEMTLAMPGAW